MNDGHADLGIGPVVAVALFLVALPLAGCVGGSGGPGSSSNGGPLPTGQNGDGATPDGNETAADDTGAHTHDRWWSGKNQLPNEGEPVEKIVLVDGTYTIDSFNETNPQGPINYCRKGGTSICWGKVYVQPMDSGQGTKVVPPGTGNITVEISYNQDNYRGIKAFYTNRFYKSQSGRSPWQPVASDLMQDGDKATISALNWRTADDGHAHTSSWEFLFEVRGNPAPGPVAYSFTDHNGLQIDVKIVAHQDPSVPPLPLEPPHPDFYQDDPDGNTSVYRVATVGGDAGDFTHAGPGYGSLPDGCYWETPGPCLPYTFGDGLTWVTTPGYKGARQGKYTENKQKLPDDGLTSPLVPPGTANILVLVTFSNNEGQNVVLCLEAVNGDGSPVTKCKDPTQGSSLTYSVPLDGGFDSYYANNWGTNASRWTFYLHLRSAEEVASAASMSVHQPGQFSGTFTATVVASNDAGLEEVPSIVTA